MEILDHLTLSFEFPNGIHVNFEANQICPPGFARVGEEFTGTKGVIETSRARMVHHQGAEGRGDRSLHARHHGNDAIEAFLTRIQNGEVENVAERSAISTLFAILGRTAIYRQARSGMERGVRRGLKKEERCAAEIFYPRWPPRRHWRKLARRSARDGSNSA